MESGAHRGSESGDYSEVSESGVAPVHVISLAGEWRFALERFHNATSDGWMNAEFAEVVSLPGSLQSQGIGDEVTTETEWTGSIFDPGYFTLPEYEPYRRPGNIKLPFWLQPERHYTGTAWYQREFSIPDSWRGRRVLLTLERPHWETRVWIDGRDFGLNQSLSVPHVYDLGADLGPGSHRLTVRVDNRLAVAVGVNSHSVSDHTQGNWNGIVGRMELSTTGNAWIDDLQVYPDPNKRSARVTGRIVNRGGESKDGAVPRTLTVRLGAELFNAGDDSGDRFVAEVIATDSNGRFSAECPLGESARLWDEFEPALYRLTAELEADGEILDTRRTVFGLREVATKGTRIAVNGEERYFRGTLECCIFPATGYPPTEADSWKRVIRIAKEHGLNHLRFHSWCPPEAAFDAADELGMYLQVECATWPNQGATIGDGSPLDRWIYEETDRILKAYGNHPSFVLMACGNEPDGVNHRDWLGCWIEHFRNLDSRRLYTGGAGWPEIPENQFHVTHPPRIHQWGDGLKSRINANPPETRTDYREYIAGREAPIISHEIGQWCAYPNFEEVSKYTGYLKPRNFEIFRERLEANHMGHQSRDFLLASGKLQTLCYKEEIESALRTPGMGGFQLLDLHDFPGQGTALVGVLDAFWDSKGYVTAEEFRRFCNSTVPLVRLGKRVFTTGETLDATVEVAHYGPGPLRKTTLAWRLEPVASGSFVSTELPGFREVTMKTEDIPIGNGIRVCDIKTGLDELIAPLRYRLVVRIEGTLDNGAGDNASGIAVENDWDIWVYPEESDMPEPGDVPMIVKVHAPLSPPFAGRSVRSGNEVGRSVRSGNDVAQKLPGRSIIIADRLDDETLENLETGGSVLLLPRAGSVGAETDAEVALGFSPIFWNTAWTGRQAPHTLGILCDPAHPALSGFPTEFHSNWQWWYLVTCARAMILDDMPRDLSPIVQVIDDWVTNRRLGLLFEARIGTGKLIVCGIDLGGTEKANPVSRQLLYSLLRYMSGDAFAPYVPVDVSAIRECLRFR